jgi:adenylylsulfate kinase
VAQNVLITGVYGSGKSSLAEEITYLLEQRREPYALLDLDFLGWGSAGGDGQTDESVLMLRNLATVASNYRDAGIDRFVLASFVRDRDELRAVTAALGAPLAVVRLTVPLPAIEQRLASDVTSGRRDDLRAAARQLAASEGADLGDLVVANDRPIGAVAREVMAWLGWL